MQKCSENMDMTVDYNNFAVSKIVSNTLISDMDYTMAYNIKQTPNIKNSQNQSRFAVSKIETTKSSSSTSPEASIDKISKIHETFSSQIEKTMNMTMQFNQSIFSNQLRGALNNVINNQFLPKNNVKDDFNFQQIEPNNDYTQVFEQYKRLNDKYASLADENEQLFNQLNIEQIKLQDLFNKKRQNVGRRQTEVYVQQIKKTNFQCQFQVNNTLYYNNLQIQLDKNVVNKFHIQYNNIFKLTISQSFAQFIKETVPFDLIITINCTTGINYIKYMLQQILPQQYLNHLGDNDLLNETSIFVNQPLSDGFELFLLQRNKYDIEPLYYHLIKKLKNYQQLTELLIENPSIMGYFTVSTQSDYDTIKQEIQGLNEEDSNILKIRESQDCVVLKNLLFQELYINNLFGDTVCKFEQHEISGTEGIQSLVACLIADGSQI